MEKDGEPAKGPAEGIRFDFGGHVFIVAARDLFSAPAECLVNPANSHLAHGGGVAGLIARRAGEALERESRAIVRARGPLRVSEAVLTTAGDLPQKGVIHVVGPQASERDVPERLAAAVHNALVLAEESGFTSIAFPAVSTGIFGVDKGTCARAFLQAVSRYFGERTESRLREVWLCLVTDDYPIFEGYFSGMRQDLNALR